MSSEAAGHFDVLIVGAGPAGSVLAIRLAQFGLRVAVVERQRFPRPCIGESLSSGVRQQLQLVGLAEAFDSLRFPRAECIQRRWGGATELHPDPSPPWLADRGAFDALLLNAARAYGVQVWQPARLDSRSVRRDGIWHLQLNTPNGLQVLSAHWLVDASGRARALRAPIRPTGAATLALHALWSGLPRLPALYAGTACWAWRVPLAEGLSRVFCFVDHPAVRGGGRAALDQRYRQALADSGILNDAPEAEMQILTSADGTPMLTSQPMQEGLLILGDAALRIDPLAACGVQVAIQTALWAAPALNTALKNPNETDLAARFYETALVDCSHRHSGFAAGFYRQALEAGLDGPFWQSRAPAAAVPETAAMPALPARLRLSRQARWIDWHCLLGTRIGSHPALAHPALDHPLAFVAGSSLQQLFTPLRQGPACSDALLGAGAGIDQRVWKSQLQRLFGLGVLRAG